MLAIGINLGASPDKCRERGANWADASERKGFD